MAVHYKFNAAKEFDTLPVDGLHISLADLKQAIIHHKRLGKGDVCDLQVTNAETKEIYKNEKELIPKNSSLIIARVPIDPALRKMGDLSRTDKDLLLSNPEYRMNTEGSEEAAALSRRLEEMPDLTKFAGTEEEKISAMMAQSTIDFHPSRYLKLRNTVMSGEVPPFYKCYKCHQGGHWVSNCPLNNQDLRKCSGIPSKFLIEVDDPKAPGVMVTKNGKYVVFRQNLGILDNPKDKVALVRTTEDPPEELICLLCKEMMQDAVLIPCCANAYCDDCIRNHLLESDDNTCPTCCKSDVAPDTLIPNRYLRLKIMQFGNQFLTELPKPNENGIVCSSPILVSKSSSNPSTPSRLPECPLSNLNTPSRTMSPTVLNDVLQMEEEEKENALKERNQSSTTEEENEAHLDTDSLSSKEKKRLKKSKKKKHGIEGKEKKHKKDKDKKKKKKEKKKAEKDRKSASEDGGVNSGSELNKSADGLMNEALIFRSYPNYPPRTVVPLQRPQLHPLTFLGAPIVRPMIHHRLPHPHPHFPQVHPIHVVHPHHSPYVNAPVDDPLATFEQYLRQKDARQRRKYKSRSSSRSPPYHSPNRGRAMGQRSRSRSRSNHRGSSPHRNRKGGRSPHSRRNYSPSPPSNSRHSHRSRSRSRSPLHHRKGSPPPFASHFHPPSESQVHSPYSSRDDKYRSKDRRDHRPPGDHGAHHQEGYHSSHRSKVVENSNDVHSKQLSGEERSRYKEMRDDNQRSSYEAEQSTHFNRSLAENAHRKEDLRNRLEDRRLIEDRRRREMELLPESVVSSSSSKRYEDELRKRGSSGRHDGRRSRASPSEDEIRNSEHRTREHRRREDRRGDSKERSKGSRRNKDDERKPKERSQPRDDSPTSEHIDKRDSQRELVEKENENKKKHKENARRSTEKLPKDEEEKPVDIKEKQEKKDETEETEDKKKHKKKKKEKRRQSQGSTGENEPEDKKQKKKEKKMKKLENNEKGIDEIPQDDDSGQKEIESEVPVVNPYLSVVSKWDKEEADEGYSYSLDERKAKDIDNRLVTSDIIKRAENALFSKSISGRPLVNKKSQGDKSKMKSTDGKKEQNSNPEWEGADSREARKRGSSIQITISSTTESQIGRPRLPKSENALSKDESIHTKKDAQIPSSTKKEDEKIKTTKKEEGEIKIKNNKSEVSNNNKNSKSNSKGNSLPLKKSIDKKLVVKDSEPQDVKLVVKDSEPQDVKLSKDSIPVDSESTNERVDVIPTQEPLITFSPGEDILEPECSTQLKDDKSDDFTASKEISGEINANELEEGELVENEDKIDTNVLNPNTEAVDNDPSLTMDCTTEILTEATDIAGTNLPYPSEIQATKKKKKKRARSSSSSSTSSSSSSSSSDEDEHKKKKRKKKKKKAKKKMKKNKRGKTENGSGDSADEDATRHKEKKKKDKKKKKSKGN